ncbi:helix-turn-helix domain-containing protein [Neorhizobium sp. NCHU2750]|uniref:helix-turn-helix domain-containing protein n=1 Tax=Neorhizobium sp. NCHU2750 TaxID=1825976 RepID=UPI000E7109BF|nr:putative terminase small subunit [Neorhizobium sp. NCHU2750]
MTAGRPTLYREEYCERVLAMASKGMSVAEWAADLGVARSTLYEWADSHSEFLTALRAGKDLEQAAWERMARENLDNKNFNANLWIKSAQARFRDDYTERQHIEQNTNFSGLPAPQFGAVTFQIVDPAKLEINQLEQLAGILESQSSEKEPLTIDHRPMSPVSEEEDK